MKGAKLLVFPSEWYEGFPMTIIEAYACGLPVIASRIGAMAELVNEGNTGLLFNPGDSIDLAQKVSELWDSPDKLTEISHKARTEYEAKYTAENNYKQLMNIYQIAIKRNKTRRDGRNT
jgi:glycosyltransferase involved in cell wall biosynthesis